MIRLPFAHQFALAPGIIILLLTGLIVFTLFDLRRISDENEAIRQWGRINDRLQIALAAGQRLDRIAEQMVLKENARDDLGFNYLEQSRIFSENALHGEVLSGIPPEVVRHIRAEEQRIRYSESLDARNARSALGTLLPRLENLYQAFLAQKRAAYADYYQNFSGIIARLITVSLLILGLCVFVAIGVSAWSYRSTRDRLRSLAAQAGQACAGKDAPMPCPSRARDEIDALAISLAQMTQRLMKVVAVEKVLEGAENERKRFAMDMHDEALGDLAALARRIDQLSETASERDSDLARHLAGLRSEVDAIAQGLRGIIEDLHPQTLGILGFGPALESYLERRARGAGLPEFHLSVDPAVDHVTTPSQQLHLLRILMEAVQNVLRHAQCTRYEIVVRQQGRDLIATVEDNGTGRRDTASEGHGISNIAARAQLMGASAEWGASRFSSGTRLTVTLPIVQADSAAGAAKMIPSANAETASMRNDTRGQVAT